MKEIHFDPTKGPLTVNIQHESHTAQDLFVTYTYRLWAANSNIVISEEQGNNFSDDDDNYPLPTPIEKNDQRVIEVLSTLKNAGDQNMDTKVTIEVLQGGQVVDTEVDTLSIPAKSNNTSHVFIILIAY